MPQPMTESQARALGPRLRRELETSDVTCPAGTACSRAVWCGVEHHYIEVAHEATSIMTYCAGNYTLCPTWRSGREADWERKSLIDS